MMWFLGFGFLGFFEFYGLLGLRGLRGQDARCAVEGGRGKMEDERLKTEDWRHLIACWTELSLSFPYRVKLSVPFYDFYHHGPPTPTPTPIMTMTIQGPAMLLETVDWIAGNLTQTLALALALYRHRKTAANNKMV